MRFTAIIKIFNGNPFVHVSAARAKTIKAGYRRPIPVFVRINGHPSASPWRINMMPMGSAGQGAFYLYLHGAVRKASGTKVGDRVVVDVRFDDTYRNGPMHPMPSWFRIPLSKNKRASAGWKKLIPSRKKEILRYFSWLTSTDARNRNIKKAFKALSGGGGRWMARSW